MRMTTVLPVSQENTEAEVYEQGALRKEGASFYLAECFRCNKKRETVSVATEGRLCGVFNDCNLHFVYNRLTNSAKIDIILRIVNIIKKRGYSNGNVRYRCIAR